MKKYIKLAIIIIIFLLAIILLIIFWPRKKVYEKEYYKKAGIKGSFFYNTIVADLGEPISVTEKPIYDHDVLYATYPQGVFTFSKHGLSDKDSYFLDYVTITDPNIKLGRKKISVGSDYKDVIKAYKGFRKIKEAELGYIDNLTWVEFELDSDKKVKSIKIYRGP
jgi:hypothetical protein